jgi:hypothetical protein
MLSFNRLVLLAVGALSVVIPRTAGAADPLTELAAVSSFKDVNLDKLAGGTVQITRGPAMSFPRGLAVESLYVVRKPVPATATLHVQWNPNKHPELKVFLHNDLSPHPTLAEFQKISQAPSIPAVKAFVAATQKLGSDGTDLQLTKAEAAAFAGQAGAASGGTIPPKVAAFWSDVLLHRAQSYLSGGITKLPPYETLGETVRTSDEIAHLLRDAPKVRSQFSALIESNPATGSKSATPQASYWEMFDADGQGALNLGVQYVRPNGDTWQGMDVEYYASGGYYVLLTFYQMWPVKVGGHDCTLIWRTDLISAATLATLHGVERMGSSTAMMRETKKTIESLLKDAK